MPATPPDNDAFLDSDGGPIPPKALMRLLSRTPSLERRVLHVHFIQGQGLSVRLDAPRLGEDLDLAEGALQNWGRALSDRFGGALADARLEVRSNNRNAPCLLPDLSAAARLLRSETRKAAERHRPGGWSSAQTVLRVEFLRTVIRGDAERECVLESRDGGLPVLRFGKDSSFASAALELEDALALWIGSGGGGRFVVEVRPGSGHEVLEDLIAGGGP